MPRKRTYTITELKRNAKLFRTALPFDVTLNGQVIASVIRPSGKWRVCENCGENTQNRTQFKGLDGKWKSFILCDKCNEELVGQS